MDYRDVHISPDQITVAILAGGKSSRFGTNKAAAVIPGTSVTLLDRAIATASDLTREIIVVGPTTEEDAGKGARVVTDLMPNSGPVGGLLTALNETITNYLLIMPCDQPLVRADDLRRLIDDLGSHAACAFLAPSGDIEPLPVVLDVSAMRALLAQRRSQAEPKLGRFLKMLNPALIDPRESRPRLRDVDTLADLNQIARQFGRGKIK